MIEPVYISTTKIKPRLHEYLRRAANGERIVITVQGIPIAELRSLVEKPDPATRAVAERFAAASRTAVVPVGAATPLPPIALPFPGTVPAYKLPGDGE